MLSRNPVLVCCIILISLLCISCKDNSVSTTGSVPSLDTSSFTYPFKDGSTWNFNRKYTAFNFRPDSVRRHFNNFPVYGNGTTTILYDTAINGITTKCFLITYTENLNSFNGREYYGNYDSGLVCYGYRSPFGTALTPFKLNRIYFSFNGYTFNSMLELFYAFENNRMAPAASNDTLVLEVPPVVCLKYPEVSGTQWLFKYIEQLGFIYKKYIGFEKVTAGVFSYSCIKTQRIWPSYSFMELFDYYSKFGILKRDYTMKDVMVLNEFGSLIGYVDLNDLYTVTSFNIPTE